MFLVNIYGSLSPSAVQICMLVVWHLKTAEAKTYQRIRPLNILFGQIHFNINAFQILKS